MTSEEINAYLQLNNYSITFNNYMNIIFTSPQISCVNCNDDGNFVLKTDDRYCWNIKIRKED